MSAKAGVAAVINTSHDVVDLLRRAFDAAGIVTVSAFTHQIRDGEMDFEAFIRQHNPDVIVYDIAPPYDANWKFFLERSESGNRWKPLLQRRTQSAEASMFQRINL